MAKIKSRRVRVLRTTSKYVKLLFLEQHCQMQLPRSIFNHRRELCLYEVLNSGTIKPAV